MNLITDAQKIDSHSQNEAENMAKRKWSDGGSEWHRVLFGHNPSGHQSSFTKKNGDELAVKLRETPTNFQVSLHQARNDVLSHIWGFLLKQ